MSWPTINGVAVKSVEKVAMRGGDDPIEGGVIIGRAAVLFANGGAADGVIILKHEMYFAVVWERDTRRFVALRMEDPLGILVGKRA